MLTALAPLRRSALRLTRSGRRRLALELGASYSATREPGLKNIERTGTVDSDGIPVRWYEYGPESAEITVLFLHGFTIPAESYYRQVEHLRTNSPEVKLLLLDIRGHGQTGPVRPDLCTIDGATDDALAVLTARNITGKLIIVGHSLGGLMAMNLVRRCPDELRACIAGLVVVGTSIEAFADQGLPQLLASPVADQVYNAIESAPDQATQFREQAAGILAPALAVAIFHRPTDYELVQFHAAMIHETPLETFVGYFDDLQVHDELAAGPHLQGIPGYVIVGDKDDITPLSQAEKIIEVWPDAWLQIAKEAGHMIPLEAPGILNAAIDRLILRVG
ncbi:alpha/beta hydrolase [Corynebacterium sp. YIM 101645]|uniref:Alpha/beta hydrolase n=1 Tax=Corynebacterium lemuris TaxID=1859292 RepID=A0ABT2FZP3_9CORY|nr:alpha/beta hydrolase [Corynebacterium lemuris]MCS5480706.1 alpha/beta hydrolase [Corynebacterium lemuris]